MVSVTSDRRSHHLEAALIGAVRAIKRLLMRILVQPTWTLEARLAQRPGVVRAAPDSPRRIEIVAESMGVEGLHRPMPGFPRSLPHAISSTRDIRRSLQEVDENPVQPRQHIDAPGQAALEAFIRASGVDAFGYTRLPPELIFEGKAVLHANAIVLAMEMDKARLDRAPSPDTAVMVLQSYEKLGKAANGIARYLRARGFSAQADHPLGGLTLFPPLAQAAGLGRLGLHGLLITPGFGPRVRLAAVFTSIVDLPDTATTEHDWIDAFCRECASCVRRCPPAAIRREPLRHPAGRISCVDPGRCLPTFVRHDGCSICIAVCPFHQRDYAWLRDRWQRHEHRSADLRANPPAGFPEHLRRPALS